MIGKRMRCPLNQLGVIQHKFNGVNIKQAKRFVRVSCETYIEKIAKAHGWTEELTHNQPVPMRSDPAYIAALEETEGPGNEEDQQELQKTMGFNYRQVMGEIIFAMVVCRPHTTWITRPMGLGLGLC